MAWKFLNLLVLFLAALSHISAVNVERKLEPKGPLKVRLDYSLAGQKPMTNTDSQIMWLFSSHLKFKNDVSSISDLQLKQIAYDAYPEMVRDMLQYKPVLDRTNKGFPERLPGVMTLLAWGNEIILASSMKGKLAFLTEMNASPVRTTLEQCQTFPGAVRDRKYGHMRDARCGEVSALHLFYKKYPNKSLKDFKDKVRIVTVERKGDTYKVINPCGWNKDTNGCDLLLKEHFKVAKWEDVAITDKGAPQPYDLKTLAGGLVEVKQPNTNPDQITAC
ncbi:hypothetical protein QQS21_002298 [Conoideocrella luteorostrata]|uniref:Uncharacterized protein n=1 Tax=Conoideocrella luteorostrata TaxID=1105319 RepID=A0AAJ0G318_9HYPO|nr:hypothetical protein QQS21_002298 [Conoideocrella luteorostrata]